MSDRDTPSRLRFANDRILFDPHPLLRHVNFVNVAPDGEHFEAISVIRFLLQSTRVDHAWYRIRRSCHGLPTTLPRLRFGRNRTSSAALTFEQWAAVLHHPICVSGPGTQYLLRLYRWSAFESDASFAIASLGTFRSAPVWWQRRDGAPLLHAPICNARLEVAPMAVTEVVQSTPTVATEAPKLPNNHSASVTPTGDSSFAVPSNLQLSQLQPGPADASSPFVSPSSTASSEASVPAQNSAAAIVQRQTLIHDTVSSALGSGNSLPVDAISSPPSVGTDPAAVPVAQQNGLPVASSPPGLVDPCTACNHVCQRVRRAHLPLLPREIEWRIIPFRIIPWDTAPLHNTCAVDCALMSLYFAVGGFRMIDESKQLPVLRTTFESLRAGDYLGAKQHWGQNACGFASDAEDYFTDLPTALFEPLATSPLFSFTQIQLSSCDGGCPAKEYARESYLSCRVPQVPETLRLCALGPLSAAQCDQCSIARLRIDTHVVTSPDLTVLFVSSPAHVSHDGPADVEYTVRWAGQEYHLQSILFHCELRTGLHNTAWLKFDPAKFANPPSDLMAGWYAYDGLATTDKTRFRYIKNIKASLKPKKGEKRSSIIIGLVYTLPYRVVSD